MTTYCEKCGAPLGNNVNFCEKCGEPVTAGKNASQQHSPHAPATSTFQSVDFVTSYLTFYLKGRVDFTANNLNLSLPNTILGLIPLGSEELTVDVNHISGTNVDFHVAFGQLIFGAIAFLLGLGGVFSSKPSFLGLVALLFGALYALNALQTTVKVALDSGDVILISLVIFEKDKANVIVNSIKQMLTARTYDTNVRIHSENSTDRIVNAINSH